MSKERFPKARRIREKHKNDTRRWRRTSANTTNATRKCERISRRKKTTLHAALAGYVSIFFHFPKTAENRDFKNKIFVLVRIKKNQLGTQPM